MKVNKLTLTNFRGIENLTIQFEPNMNALIGINGSGKSSVLDALAIALSNVIARINGNANKARKMTEYDILKGKSFAKIDLEIEINEKKISYSIAHNRKATDKSESSNFSQLKDAIQDLIKIWERQEVFSLPLASFYDVNRAALDVPLRVRETLKNLPDEVYSDALEPGGTDFKRFFIWFRNQEDFENQQIKAKQDFNFKDIQLESIRKAITYFTGLTEIAVERKPKMHMVVKKGNLKLDIKSQLSDGERNMLALIGDMTRRLAILNPQLDESQNGQGVILIDELDLHLHPRWQREVIKKLPKFYPHCQFIITTHSPQMLGELEAKSIHLLKNGQLHPVEKSIGLSSNDILTILMGADDYNIEFKNKVKEIDDLLDNDVMEQVHLDELNEKIDDLYVQYGSVPEVMRLQEHLEWEKLAFVADNDTDEDE